MIKQQKNIEQIKQEIITFYQKDVLVKVNLGRKKFASYKGKLTGIYPNLVTISPYDGYLGKTNFSYADFLCGLVKIEKTIII